MNIEFVNQQDSLPIDEPLLRSAIERIASAAEIATGEVSLAVVTDDELHRLNKQHLAHDYPTDVLSFVFEREGIHLEGEILVSADMAITTAAEFDWPAENELLLYVVHGMLHLVGYDDKLPADRVEMRAAERRFMKQLGIEMPEEKISS